MKGGGGGTTSFEIYLTWDLEVLAILNGGETHFHSFKGQGGAKKSSLERGAESLGPAIFPFCSPLPVFNDRSLRKRKVECVSYTLRVSLDGHYRRPGSVDRDVGSGAWRDPTGG